MIESPVQVTPADVARHYDEVDRFYRELWGEHLHHGLWRNGRRRPEEAVRDLLHLVFDRVGIQPGQSVCDVGCGYGGTTRFLAEHWAAKSIGFTVSAKQYQHAKSQADYGGLCSYVLGDWLCNNMESESQDAVLAIESSEHFTDKLCFFQEAFRVLRLGGRMAVCAWLSAENPKPWQVRYLLEPICSEGRLPGLATRAEYQYWMEAAGFEGVEFIDLSSGVSRTWTICVRRMAWQLATTYSSWRFLFDRRIENRDFARAVIRISLGYKTGCLRYGLFTARKS